MAAEHERTAVSWALLNNPHCVTSSEQVRHSRCTNSPTSLHKLSTCPLYTSQWAGNKFKTKSVFKYNQFTCNTRGCNKRVHTYCDCAPGDWLCHVHWRVHYVESLFREFHGNWIQPRLRRDFLCFCPFSFYIVEVEITIAYYTSNFRVFCLFQYYIFNSRKSWMFIQ
jgi:hypothetical protein